MCRALFLARGSIFLLQRTSFLSLLSHLRTQTLAMVAEDELALADYVDGIPAEPVEKPRVVEPARRMIREFALDIANPQWYG